MGTRYTNQGMDDNRPQYRNRYTMSEDIQGYVTLTPQPGEIINPSAQPMSGANIQRLEVAVEQIDDDLATAESDIGTLKTGLSNEISNRIAGDNALQTNLDTEEAARIAGDNQLTTSVNELTDALNDESIIRSETDNYLQQQINALTAGATGELKTTDSLATLLAAAGITPSGTLTNSDLIALLTFNGILEISCLFDESTDAALFQYGTKLYKGTTLGTINIRFTEPIVSVKVDVTEFETSYENGTTNGRVTSGKINVSSTSGFINVTDLGIPDSNITFDSTASGLPTAALGAGTGSVTTVDNVRVLKLIDSSNQTFTRVAVDNTWLDYDRNVKVEDSKTWVAQSYDITDLNYVDADHVGENFATILTAIKSDVSSRDTSRSEGETTITMTASSTTQPNLNTAFRALLTSLYGVTTLPSTISIVYRQLRNNYSVPATIKVTGNNSVNTYEVLVDNYGINYQTNNNDAFRKPTNHSNSPYGSSFDRNVRLYHSNGYYLYEGQSIALNLGDYSIYDFTKLHMVFAPFNEGEITWNNQTTYTLHNSSLGSDVDAYFNHHSFGVKGLGYDEYPVLKSCNLQLDGTIAGSGDPTSTLVRSAVIFSVWGELNETAYEGVATLGITSKTRENKSLPVPTISTYDIPKDAPCIYLKDATNAYDVYDMSESELAEFEKQYKGE